MSFIQCEAAQERLNGLYEHTDQAWFPSIGPAYSISEKACCED